MRICKLISTRHYIGNELNSPPSFLASFVDPDDNTLTIKCRPDKKFDVPSSDNLPDCLAQCPKEKPVPPPENNIELDTTRSPDRKLWEKEDLW